LTGLIPLLIGFALLFIGGECLVRGSTSLAIRFGLPPLIAGLTIVSFGTSSPELMVSVQAALDGNAGISLGNIVGSNICNIGLILGVCAMVRPMTVNRQMVQFDIPMMVGVSVLLAVLLSFWELSRGVSLVFVAGLVIYLWGSFRVSKKDQGDDVLKEVKDTALVSRSGLLLAWGMTIGGIFLLFYGSSFIINGATTIAKYFGINDTVIGLTIVAIGTSLPELATTLVAALKKNFDIALGNVVGSNIFNTLGVLGIVGVIRPFSENHVGWVSVVVMLVLSVALLPLVRKKAHLSRWAGLLFVTMYIGYLFYLYTYPNQGGLG